MGKEKKKQPKANGEVLADVKEGAAIEQYWQLAARSKLRIQSTFAPSNILKDKYR